MKTSLAWKRFTYITIYAKDLYNNTQETTKNLFYFYLFILFFSLHIVKYFGIELVDVVKQFIYNVQKPHRDGEREKRH